MIKELTPNDIESIKNRLQGRSYQSHIWKPIDFMTIFQCTLCNEKVFSGKDRWNPEEFTKFWKELRKRRDCPRKKPVTIKENIFPPLHPNCRSINIRNIGIIGITVADD